jgi:predicted PurR-regulated permease PerM
VGDGDEVEGWRLLVPAGYDVLWTGTVLLLLALLAAALVLWVRRRRVGRASLVELALVLGVPVIGPAGYLVGEALAHRARRAVPTDPPR